MKKIILFILLVTIFNIKDVKAAFDLESKNATYDSNTGIVTIYDNNFSSNEYIANVSKMKLGSINLNGYYEFKTGLLKVYLKNKSEVNNQVAFTQNNTISNALFLEYGSIVKSYRPPNSINVVLESHSNIKNLNIDVVGLRPKLIINNFISNISTLGSDGGEVILTINGDNLDTASFKIHQLNTNIKYDLNSTKKTATVKISISPNYMETDRINSFVLYVNGIETDKKLDILVSRVEQAPVIPPNGSNNNQSNNSSNNNQSNNNLVTDNNLNGGDKSTNIINNTDKVENTVDDNINEQKNNSVTEKKDLNKGNKNNEKQKNNVTIIIVLIGFLIILTIFVSHIVKIKKHD